MSQFALTDKVAIVTGGGGTAHGIGSCIATTFAQAGAKVAVVGRHQESLNKVVDIITGQRTVVPFAGRASFLTGPMGID